MLMTLMVSVLPETLKDGDDEYEKDIRNIGILPELADPGWKGE